MPRWIHILPGALLLGAALVGSSATALQTAWGCTPTFTTLALPAGWSLINVILANGIEGLVQPDPIIVVTWDGMTYTTSDKPVALVPFAAGGVGAWIYSPRAITLPLASPCLPVPPIPVQPNRWQLIANVNTVPVKVAGADAVWTYSQEFGYQQTDVLQPQQGAWVFSRSGGAIVLTALPQQQAIS